MTAEKAVAGVFVGGAATRMGGVAKGLLRGPDGVTLVERWRGLLSALGVRVVLVGEAAAYAGTGLPVLADEPAGIGPLGGLVALLRHAGTAPALAFACDMPFVSPALVARLLAAPAGAPIVAPRRDARWEPLCARYDAARVLPQAVALAASPRRSLQRLLDEAGAEALPLLAHEDAELRDWDSPADVDAGGVTES
ncbi:MAG TPA: molybdenum cofactor guanylyltransferase [Polyangiaceae bacterium]|nr:molybdenum cofactor guanylyltransferase [Polyangiaceae bacterium]